MLKQILTAIFCATAPLSSVEFIDSRTEQSQPSLRLGKETVAAVRQAYEKGEYSEFLTEMDTSYKQALANQDLDGLIQMRQKPIPTDFQQKWEQSFSDLQKLKHQELLTAISDKDDSLFAQKVRSVAANVSTPEQEKAIAKLNAFIAMAPKAGANADENTLADIDLEYEYKILHAQLPLSDTSPQQIEAHQIALRMEKMDRMLTASKTFQDLALKQAVGLAAANLDVRLARNLDGVDLNVLIRNRVKPGNATEEKVFSILSAYQGQFSDLMKEIDQANR